MKTLAVTVLTKKQELLFINLAEQLGIDVTEAKFKPLSTRDAALGIGRKFTDDELSEYLQRTSGGKAKSANKAKRYLKSRIGNKSSLK